MLLVGDAELFTLSVRDYPPGDYNFTINATDIYGQSVIEVVQFFLSGEDA